MKKSQKTFKKLLTNKKNGAIIGYKFEYHRNDYDEDEEIFPNLKLEVKSEIELYEKGNTLGGTKYERENK